MLKIILPLTLSLVSCTSTPKAVRPYVLDTCVVMDSKLGTMGDPIVRVYKGQEVKFCCAPCVDEFESDPEFYLEKMEQE
ncbi:MAG: YHS domain-containing protein [Planctomycetota bacterium]|jgi:YHS domain-containing protein